jgi:hypothetical protein
MTRYLMNSATIPHGCTGTFTYRLATVEDLVAFLQAGEVVNTIIYPDTLAWVREVTGQRVKRPPDDATRSPLQPADEAFVIRRVTRRVQDWKLPFDPAVMEFGILRCEVPPAPKPTHKRGEKRQVLRQARARKKG